MADTEQRRFLWRVLGLLPNVVILGGLAGLGYWGMTHEWKISSAEHSASDDSHWCSDHNVPSDICVMCKPEIMPTGTEYGWCRTHGVHECTLCHPESAQLATPYVVTEADRTRAQAALAFSPRPDNDRREQLHLRRIQFATQEQFDKAGIEVVPVWKDPLVEAVSVHGAITHDPGRVAHYSCRAPGSVVKVFKHLGDRVAAGEVLALIDAAAVGQAKAELMQALVQWEVRSKARAQMQPGVVPEASILAADAAVREAKIRLASARQALINLGLPAPEPSQRFTEEQLTEHMLYLGLPETLTKDLDPRTTSNNLLPVRATLSGTIMSRDVVAGEVVDANKMLFAIVDTSRVWLTVGVRSEDVSKIQLERTHVRFAPEGYTGMVTAPVTWISTEADPKTRLVNVRAELPNPDGRLRANTFGHGQVVLRAEAETIVIPKEAVHVEQGSHYVFVRTKNFLSADGYKVFHVRTVRIGASDDKNVEIIAGVLPGEIVATKNSGLLMAELRRSQIGAGCCGD